MSKRTLSVTVDGQTFTRTTAADYTHVVVARCVDGTVEALAWASSEKGAQSALRHNRVTASMKGTQGHARWGSPDNLSIVEVI